jgi:hypothetical protein
VNRQAGQGRTSHIGSEQLTERLHGVQQPGIARRDRHDFAGLDDQHIVFLGCFRTECDFRQGSPAADRYSQYPSLGVQLAERDLRRSGPLEIVEQRLQQVPPGSAWKIPVV